MAKFVVFDRVGGVSALPLKISVNPLTVSLLWPQDTDKTTITIGGMVESPIIVQGSSDQIRQRLEDAMK